jgi:type II secretory pathway component PulC
VPVLTYLRTTVNLDADVHKVLQDEIGPNQISEYFRLVEEETVYGSEEERSLSIRARAKRVADRTRKKLLEQRKLVQDQDFVAEMREKEARDRADLIRQVTLAEIRAQKFRAIDLPEADDQHFSSEGIRKKLVDEIAHRCQIDLQWKDVEQYVRMAVRV